MSSDYYSILGVPKTANADEIKRAYRKLAHQHHPDKSNSSGDSEKFKQANEAYEVLSDPEKRAQYDQYGTTFEQARRNGGYGSGFSGFSGADFSDFSRGFGFDAENFGFDDAFDIFSDIFGASRTRRARREHGVDIETELGLSFEEAVFGTEKEIAIEKKNLCATCGGSGAEPGSKISTCPKCHGSGQYQTAKRTIFGQVATVVTCNECEGSGKIAENACGNCQGTGQKKGVKRLKVKIPAGVDDGQRIRVANEGEVGYRGSGFGDLFLRLNVASHPDFKREGFDIYSDALVSFSQAALGITIETGTVDGRVNIKIPAGTQTGKVFRLKNKGVPRLNASGRGDHFVKVTVVTPSKLSKKEKELFQELSKHEKNPSSFWDRF